MLCTAKLSALKGFDMAVEYTITNHPVMTKSFRKSLTSDSLIGTRSWLLV